MVKLYNIYHIIKLNVKIYFLRNVTFAFYAGANKWLNYYRDCLGHYIFLSQSNRDSSTH